MQYKANPVTVEAHIIIGAGPVLPNGSMHCALQNGENAVADKSKLARFIPQAGDYWVIQEDGYVYLNPKDVFERKYGPVSATRKDVPESGAAIG
jgi:hypothetical protein